MSSLGQLQLLRTEIEHELNRFRSKRLRDKRKAAWLKVGAVLCAALVTVLLGLQIADAQAAGVLKNIALGLGAAIIVINTYDAFFDHRSLWIRRTETVGRLHELWMDFRFYAAGINEPSSDASDAPDPTILTEFKARLTRILQEDSREWVRLRTPSTDDQPNPDRSPTQPAVDSTGGGR